MPRRRNGDSDVRVTRTGLFRIDEALTGPETFRCAERRSRRSGPLQDATPCGTIGLVAMTGSDQCNSARATSPAVRRVSPRLTSRKPAGSSSASPNRCETSSGGVMNQSRRWFFGQCAGVVGTSAVSAMIGRAAETAQTQPPLQNWAGNYRYGTNRITSATSVAQVQEFVRTTRAVQGARSLATASMGLRTAQTPSSRFATWRTWSNWIARRGRSRWSRE